MSAHNQAELAKLIDLVLPLVGLLVVVGIFKLIELILDY